MLSFQLKANVTLSIQKMALDVKGKAVIKSFGLIFWLMLSLGLHYEALPSAACHAYYLKSFIACVCDYFLLERNPPGGLCQL